MSIFIDGEEWTPVPDLTPILDGLLGRHDEDEVIEETPVPDLTPILDELLAVERAERSND